jgi:hypothetical protein
MIDDYMFGCMVIGGKTYYSDLLVFPDGTVQCPWWREESHRLSAADLVTVLDVQPEILIAGTGSSGMMQPDGDLQASLARRAIELVALPTDEAVGIFNDLVGRRKVCACFHLTC